MITKKIISVGESKNFFDSSINTLEDAMGLCLIDETKKTIRFNKKAINIFSNEKIFSDETYSRKDVLKYDNFRFLENLSEMPNDFDIIYDDRKLMIKLEKLSNSKMNMFVIDYNKLLETEKELTRFNNVIQTNTPVYTVCTWWIDYDKQSGSFYQTPSGPKLLGVPISEDGLYVTRDFQEVRAKAARKTAFYDECIRAEQEMYENVRNNKSDYFGGRTPTYTIHDAEIWVESYGKCLLRYSDGSPRLFVALDIYLSDLLESSNQITTLNSLIDQGLVNSEIGIWYYQKYHNEGKYYFTDSHKKLMKVEEELTNENVTKKLDRHFAEIIKHSPELEDYLVDFRTTHAMIFEGNLDSYRKIVPNHLIKDKPQWVEVRGTVIERDENGEVRLFIGVNVDVTETVQKNIELERLRNENEHLHLAEKLAIKAGDVLVWYQDFEHMDNKHYLYGNDTFVDKLGVERNEEGLISLNKLRRSMCRGDDVSREMTKDFIVQLNELYSGKTKTIKGVLVKHCSLNSCTERIYEHTIEVEETFEDGSLKLVGGFMRDVTDNIRKQEEITYLANNDILTGLNNRNYFETYISNGLPNDYSVILFDLDGLKLLNDAFGHIEGDKVIKMIADFIKDIYKGSLLLARIGGDEFLVISNSVDDDYFQEKFDDLDRRINAYNEESAVEINVSKGGFTNAGNKVSFEAAFTQAENLMYRRKLNNRSSRKSKVLDSIIETLNAKTEETKEHSNRIANLCVSTLKSLGRSRVAELEDMKLLAMVHDVGKITIPDSVLHKAGKLTADEYEVIKKHSEAGYKIIKNITDSDLVSEGVLCHHERFDGTGYPRGLKGEDIPLYARIISVADSYDAMTSNRIYQKRKTKEEAIDEIIRCSGSQFDPEIVEVFLKACFDIDLSKKANN